MPNSLRNIMDMKANMGSFAAALKDKDVWVMNVVPDDGPNTLKIIYDRGLIGSVHNWCEAFSTYPRTYDLLHAWNILSDIEKKGCSMADLLIEMDRILRPTGFIIFRDRQCWISLRSIYKLCTGKQWQQQLPSQTRNKLWLTSESLKGFRIRQHSLASRLTFHFIHPRH